MIGRVRRMGMYASEKEDNMVNILGRKIRRVIAYVLMIAILAGILPQEAFAAAETEM